MGNRWANKKFIIAFALALLICACATTYDRENRFDTLVSARFNSITKIHCLNRTALSEATRAEFHVKVQQSRDNPLRVCVHAFDRLGRDHRGIVGITMPGFGTTDRTYTNAVNLMKELFPQDEYDFTQFDGVATALHQLSSAFRHTRSTGSEEQQALFADYAESMENYFDKRMKTFIAKSEQLRKKADAAKREKGKK